MKRLLLLLLLSAMAAQAQDKTSYRWYFGTRDGLNFNTNPPSVLTDGLSVHIEGTSSASDAQTGALVLYSDGNTVWNRNHAVIATGLNPNYNSSTQSSLIIRQPGSNSLYYLFTTENQGMGRARYFVIDISGNGGAGAVVTTNNALTPANVTEKVTATRACNGTDYWIVFERNGVGTPGFYTFKLTGSGLDLNPVVSTQGFAIDNSSKNIGAMCISPDGRHLASANYSADCALFDFDNSNGQVTNPRTVTLNSSHSCYGVSFSASSRYLYVNSGWAGPKDSVVRFDMNAANTQASLQKIGQASAAMGYMELAPDGKMYIARYSTKYVATITDPDGISPVYADSAISFPNNVLWGLPNFPQDLFIPNYAGPDVVVCPNTPTRLGIAPVAGMAYSWTPSTGLDDPSSAQPLVTISTAMSYTVTVSDNRGCIIQRSVNVNVHSRPAFTVNSDDPDNTVCSGTTVALSATAGTVRSISWMPGSLSGGIVRVNPTQTTTYVATVTDTVGCEWKDSVTVTVLPLPTVAITSSTPALSDTVSACMGQSVMLSGTPGLSMYSWSTGENTSSITVDTSARIWLKGTDAKGCENFDTIVVRIWSLPAVNAGNDVKVCSGTVYRLQGVAPTASVVRWHALDAGASLTSDSTSLSPTIQTDTAGTFGYELFVSDINGCTRRDTMLLTVWPLPVATLSPSVSDTNLCPCSTITLAALPGYVYQWYADSTVLNGQTQQSITIAKQGSYYVQLTDSTGCVKNSSPTIVDFIPLRANVVVSVADSAYDGEDVHLKLSATGQHLTECPLDSATVYLHMNRYPLAPSPGEQFGSLSGTSDRSLPVRVKFVDGVMSRDLHYIGTLGAIDTTVISVDSVSYDSCPIITSTVPATFHLAGVCRARGTARLYISPLLSLLVLPNPTNGHAVLQMQSDGEAPGSTIQVRDLLGRVLYQRSVDLLAGLQSVNLPVDNLPDGTYVLQVMVNASVNTTMLEVQR